MIATIPSASTILASSSAWSSPIFNEFLPVAYMTIGVAAGVILLILFGSILISGFERFSHHAMGEPPKFKHYGSERQQQLYHENLTSAYFLTANDPAGRARVVAQMEEEKKFL